MLCIYCSAETQVINSRPQKRLNHIWRRRQCVSCEAIFTTSEEPDLLKGLSVKNGKQMQPFSRDKLFLSLYDSLRHRKHATADATGLTDTVIARLYPHIETGTISSADIIKSVLLALNRFDKPAATHYLAFHPLP